MKSKIYSLLLAAGILLSGFSRAHAESGQCGEGVYWSFEDSVLTVTGHGVISDRSYSHLVSKIKLLIIEEGVTGVGDDAFNSYPSLATVILPKTLKSIGNWAFYNGGKLTTVVSLNPEPPVMTDWSALGNWQNITAYVPPGSLEAYQSANVWAYIYEGSRMKEAGFSAGVSLSKNSLKMTSGSKTRLTASSGKIIKLLNNTIVLLDNSFIWESDNPEVATVSQTGVVTAVSGGTAVISVTTEDGIFEATAEVTVEPGNARSGQCGDGVDWSFEDSVLTVFGTGPMWGYGIYHDRDASPWDSFKESIGTVIINEGVTSLGREVFAGCVSLDSCVIPSTVEGMGSYAFARCPSLTSVNLPQGLVSIEGEAFQGSGLTSIAIPENVTRIGDYAFDCPSLSLIVFLNPVPTEINYSIFHAYDKSVFVAFVPEGSLESYRNAGGWKDYNLKAIKYVTEVSLNKNSFNMALGGKTRLTATVSPDGAELLPDNTLANFIWESSNPEVATVSQTGEVNAVSEGTAVISFITATAEVTVASRQVSSMCGDDVTWSLNSDEGVLTVSGTGPMYDYYWDADLPPWYELRYGIKSVIIEEGVTHLGRMAFVYLVNLTSVTIPEGVTSIAAYCFYGCYALASVTIPASVTTMEFWSFRDLSSLTSVTCLNPVPPTGSIDWEISAFEGSPVSNAILYVPAGSGNAYRNAVDWKEFGVTAAVNPLYTPLKSLAVTNTDMAFLFSPDRFGYSFIVSNDIDSITVEAVPEDATASVTGTGKYPTVVGDNIFHVAVTPENGTEAGTVYTVKIRRLSNDATLQSLTVEKLVEFMDEEGYLQHIAKKTDLNFSPGVFDYRVSVDEDTHAVDINATPNNTFSRVSGTGFYELEPYPEDPFVDERIFTVTVTAEDRTKLTYTVTVEKYRESPARLEKTGQQPVRVYTANGVLHVDSPVAERINVYSVTGTLLYGFDKPAGAAVREGRVNPAPAPVLIVKGSSGWTGKIMNYKLPRPM